jgi:hypothetical protein
MVFIVPFKRTSISGSAYFSKYKDWKTTGLFVLQSLKDPPDKERHHYRIITRGEHPFYLLAVSNDREEILAHDWSYVSVTLPEIILKEVQPKLRHVDDLQKWLVAHFTKLVLDRKNNKLSDAKTKSVRFSGEEDIEEESMHVRLHRSQSGPFSDSEHDLPAEEYTATAVKRTQKKKFRSGSNSGSSSSNTSPPLYVLPTPSPTLQVQGWGYALLCICVFNIYSILVQQCDDDTFFHVLVLANITLAVLFLFSGSNKNMIVIAPVSSKNPFKDAALDTAKILRRAGMDGGGGLENGSGGNGSDKVFTHYMGSPVDTLSRNEGSVVMESATVKRPVSVNPAWWKPTDATVFKVRYPNYRQLKEKGASKGEIMALAGMDIFKTPKKVDHISRFLVFPQPKNEAALTGADFASFTGQDSGIPLYWVVHFQLPAYTPSMFNKEGDGEGWSILMYFSLTGARRQAVLAQPDGAVALASKFFQSDLSDQKGPMRQLKGIPFISNAADVDLGFSLNQLMKQYQAKPFLTGPTCHRFFRGQGYVETVVDFHQYAYPARKGVDGFKDYFKDYIIDFGLVVEGREEEGDVLPERMLGCVNLRSLDVSNIQALDECYTLPAEITDTWKK